MKKVEVGENLIRRWDMKKVEVGENLIGRWDMKKVEVGENLIGRWNMFSTKKCIHFCLIFLVLALLMLFGPCESWAQKKQTLTWGSTSSTSGLFNIFIVTSKLLNDNSPEINLTVRTTGASVHNARLLEKREIDIGAVDTTTFGDAIRGEYSFKGKPFNDFRILNVLTNTQAQFVVSEKSGVKDIYGLEGKPYNPGMLGGSTEQTSMKIFNVLGIRPRLHHSGLADAIEAMKNETIVGFMKLGAPDASILDVASAMKIRILSFSERELEKILANDPGLTSTVIPSGLYHGVGEIKTIQSLWCNIVRTDFPAELAYKIVKGIWENREEIKKANVVFVGNKIPELAMTINSGYLHPGAVKFYRELGYTVPKRLLPPEIGEK